MKLQKALDKAKIGIMLHGSVFISTVAFSMRHVFSKDMPYAGTDGRQIIYNPDWFESLEPNERIALIAHEAWHVALMHMTRQGDRDKDLYNRAGDYVINQLLIDDGFELPPGGCQNDKFRGMSTNQVYDLIKDDPDEQPDKSNGDIMIAAEGSGEDGDKDGKGKKPNSPGEIEAHIKAILVKATTQAKMHGDQAGSIPGEILRHLDKLINPRLPWEALLQRFLTERVKEDYTWKRPNKRFAPEFYLPTQHSESLSHLTIAIDTSGSITNDDLLAILSEIQYIRDTFKPKKMTILDCDSAIHNIYECDETTHILDLKFSGGGGTSCFPVFEYIEKHPTTALIYFTDLYLQNYDKEISYPVLWVVYDNPDAHVEIGEIIHYEI